MLRVVLVPFVIGWIVALAFAALIARLEYTAVVEALPSKQVAAEYQARVDHDMRSGPLLWLPQIGVVCGLMAWQIARSARSAQTGENPIRYGTIVGLVMAIVEGGIALAMQVPIPLVVALIMLLVGVGTFAGWSAMNIADMQRRSVIP
jgi:hypothetical protein